MYVARPAPNVTNNSSPFFGPSDGWKKSDNLGSGVKGFLHFENIR